MPTPDINMRNIHISATALVGAIILQLLTVFFIFLQGNKVQVDHVTGVIWKKYFRCSFAKFKNFDMNEKPPLSVIYYIF